jgi:hypothetical protein
MSKLSDIVTVSRRFQRSVRLDTDHAIDGALQGYVCHGSSRQAMETMARLFQETGQRAFTWTDPMVAASRALRCYSAKPLAAVSQQNQAGLSCLAMSLDFP